MNQVERRCVLMHELVHLRRGHRGCQSPTTERQVRAEAARYLIAIEDLEQEAAWALSLAELADELWVTEMVLCDRLSSLTDRERQRLPERLQEFVRRIWIP